MTFMILSNTILLNLRGESAARSKGGEAAHVRAIRRGLLKAGGEALIRLLHAALTAACQSCSIPPDRSGLAGKGKRIGRTEITIGVFQCSEGRVRRPPVPR